MMRNLSKSPAVSIPKTRLLTCVLALSLLVSACGMHPASADAPVSAKITPAAATALSRLEAGQALDGRIARSDAEGRLEVYVRVSDMSTNTLQRLMSQGLVHAVASPALGLVQGWIAPGDVSRLASLSVVTRITLPQYASHF
jgi:hypothetical protein